MKGLKFVFILFALVLFSSLVNADGLVNISPDQPKDNDNLICNIEGATAETIDDYVYFWYVNNDLSDETSWVFSASETSVGNNVLCFVTDALGSYVGSDSVVIQTSVLNNAPDVEIVKPTDGAVFYVNQVIEFEAVTSDPDGTPLVAFWNFGEETDDIFDFLGSFAIGNNAFHSYDEVGSYTVKAFVSDGELGDADAIIINIISTPLNQEPNAVATASDTTPCVGQNIAFDGTDSFDADGEIVDYEWDFGDGDFAVGSMTEHAYENNGIYTVTLTVTDNDGLEDSTNVFIAATSNCKVPVADAGPDMEVGVGQVVGFDGSESDDDGEIIDYEWDFGDGTSGSGQKTVHTYNALGSYTVTLTVTDNEGFTDSDTALVNVVVLDAPVAVINVNSNNGFAGFVLNFDGTDSFDADGEIVDYEWDFGDGTSSNGKIVNHVFDDVGVFTVTLTVIDNDGLTGSTSVSINVDKFFKGSDADKPVLVIPNMRDFEISKITQLNYKQFYNKGERVSLLVKLTNEGGFDEELALKVLVPEFNYKYNVNDISLDMSQVKMVLVNLDIPNNAVSGIHIARFSLGSRDSENDKVAYWQFIVL